MHRLLVATVVVFGAITPENAVKTGCALFKGATQGAFTNPTFTFKNVALHDASLSGIGLDTKWDMNNPNAVSLSLASVDYALFIDDKQVVAGRPANGFQIPAKGSTELVFPANINFLDVVPTLETLLTKDTATWRAEGGLGLQTPIGVIRIPLSAQNVFETPKIPQIAFGNPKVSNLSLQGATVEFPLNVTNRSSFPIPIKGVAGNLAIAGANVGTLSTGDLGQLDGKGTKTLTLPLTINFLQAGTAAMTAVKGGNANVGFNAAVESGQAKLPINLNQAVSFIK